MAVLLHGLLTRRRRRKSRARLVRAAEDRRSALEQGAAAPVSAELRDKLLQTAEERFGALEDLPFSGIMPEIAAYEVKRRSRRSKDEDK